jgi:DHA1 family inner membrane transport protein
MVPAMAMLTASIEPRYRGGFMSMNSSVQNLSSGVAAWLGGVIIHTTPTGQLSRFGFVGLASVVCGLLTIYFSRFLRVTGGTTVGGFVEG